MIISPKQITNWSANLRSFWILKALPTKFCNVIGDSIRLSTIDKVIAVLSEDMKKFSEEKNKQFQEITGISDGLVNVLKEGYDEDKHQSLRNLIKVLKDITHGNK